MSKTSIRMLVTCAGAFVVSTALVACGVFAALSRASGNAPDPLGTNRQAEQAAIAVVRPYYAAIGEIGAAGGVNPQRIDRYVTEGHGSQLSVVFASMRNDGWKTTGRPVVVNEELVNRRADVNGVVSLEVRVCLDVSHTRVIGRFGEDQTPAARVDRVPYDVWITTSGASGRSLRIESTRLREELAPC